MTLSPGSRLGSYEVLARLGAGGMGEVWRAADPKLGREVALKVLPDELSQNPEALLRFEREARAVAALSHPNILAIHDFGVVGGQAVAVMELLEGETLRDRLTEGALPQRKAVEYAQQIAQGLAAAHDKGIVHRDLKPENLFVTREGRVKILDFGLAKNVERAQADDVTHAPTSGHTTPGMVVGTVGYMSPEQVRSGSIDHRSDIFSFGAILYEMLAGERAFRRETSPETLTAILREDPRDLSASNPRIDPALDSLVRHCLEKSPDERFQSAKDLAYALSAIASSSAPVTGETRSPARAKARPKAPPSNAVLAGILGGALMGALLGALWGRLLGPRGAASPTFQVLTYSGRDAQPSASPDGKTVAFASTRGGASRIWIKQLAGGAEAVLTEGVDRFPRISPDGSTVLFIRESAGERALYRIPLVGGDARKVVGKAEEADWSPDGREIVFVRSETREGRLESSVRRVAADGTGERTVAQVADHVLMRPRWSPDGRAIAAIQNIGTGRPRPRIVLFPLDGSAAPALEEAPADPTFTFAWNGDSRHLILVGGGLTADASVGGRTRQVVQLDTRTGRTRTLLSGIDLRGPFDVLGRGALVLTMGGPRSNLREIPLRSVESGRWLTRGNCVDRQPVHAPDGDWVAFTSNRAGNSDVWELSTRTGAVRRLTENPAEDFDPAFTPDGKRLLFSSNRSGHFEIWTAERDGSGARQLSNDGVDAENATATPDGQWIVYVSFNPSRRGLWKMRADGSAPSSLVPGAVILPEISPDGTLVSFVSPREVPKRIRAVRLADGASVPFEIAFQGLRGITGRHRWMPGGRALAIELESETGDMGVALQDFAPGRDTAASRRPIAGFSADSWIESFGVSPDGASLVASALDEPSSLLLAEGVEGIVPRPAPAR